MKIFCDTSVLVAGAVRSHEHYTRAFSDNVVRHFNMQTLNALDNAASVSAAAENGVIGGAIYDVLLLAAAQKAKPDRIYTFNVAEFRRLAPDLQDLIAAP